MLPLLFAFHSTAVHVALTGGVWVTAGFCPVVKLWFIVIISAARWAAAVFWVFAGGIWASPLVMTTVDAVFIRAVAGTPPMARKKFKRRSMSVVNAALFPPSAFNAVE